MSRANRRIFVILFVGCVVGFVSAIPYALAVQGETLSRLSERTPVPLPRVLALQFVVSAVVSAAVILIGLRWRSRVPFGFPILDVWNQPDERRRAVRAVVPRAVLAGIACFALIGALNWLMNRTLGVPQVTSRPLEPSPWKGCLAAFYGGINEEVLLRLFLMTTVTAGLFRITRARASAGRAMIWIAIVLSSLIFGAAHLPAVVGAGMALTFSTVIRIVLLNMSAGVVFGWLYWRHGFEAAALAHFSTDLLLHGLLPALR